MIVFILLPVLLSTVNQNLSRLRSVCQALDIFLLAAILVS